MPLSPAAATPPSPSPLRSASRPVGGTDVVGLSAVVTAATGHSGELASDAEATTVVEGVFIDGFQAGDTSAWSITVGGF